MFWDVDGTLADTEMDGHRPAFNLAFQEVGLDWCWNPDLYRRLLSIPGGTQRVLHYAREVGAQVGQSQLQHLKRVKQSHYLDLVRSRAVSLRPGVLRLINELRCHGISQWIVTSSGRASVDALLETFFPADPTPFAGVVSSDDVSRHKPHPAPYRCALERSGVLPESGLAIEDSAAGLRAATASSLSCLLTPSPWDQDLGDLFDRACAVVSHLGEPSHHLDLMSGPTCPEGMITLEYLQSLLENDA